MYGANKLLIPNHAFDNIYVGMQCFVCVHAGSSGCRCGWMRASGYGCLCGCWTCISQLCTCVQVDIDVDVCVQVGWICLWMWCMHIRRLLCMCVCMWIWMYLWMSSMFFTMNAYANANACLGESETYIFHLPSNSSAQYKCGWRGSTCQSRNGYEPSSRLASHYNTKARCQTEIDNSCALFNNYFLVSMWWYKRM